jgi:hypothetical protein
MTEQQYRNRLAQWIRADRKRVRELLDKAPASRPEFRKDVWFSIRAKHWHMIPLRKG